MNNGPQVKIISRHRWRYRFVRPSRLGRWFRERWLPSAALSGDPVVDETWAVESRERELMAALLVRPDVREALRSLAQLDVTAITNFGGFVRAGIRLPRGTQLDEDLHVEPIRRALLAIDAALHELVSSGAMARPGRGWRAWLLTMLTLLGWAVVLVQAFHTFVDHAQDQFDPVGAMVRYSLVVGIPLALVSVALVLRFLKGHLASTDEATNTAFGVALLSLALGWVGALQLNARLDSGPATTIEVVVLNVIPLESRLTGVTGVIAWKPGARKTQALFVTRDVATVLVPGESWLILTTSPGWLGIERRVSVRTELRPDPDDTIRRLIEKK